MLKKFKLIGIVALIGILALGLFGCGSSGGSDKTQGGGQNGGGTIELKLGHLQDEKHPYQQGALKFKELVEQKTGGKVKVTIFPNSLLGSARDQLEGLQMGTVDIHLGSVAPLANFAPKMGVLDLPYLFRDPAHAYKVLDGEVGKQLASELNGKGFQLISWWDNGFRHMTNDIRPINKPEDVKGMKIRVMESPVYMAFIKALGGDPTPMAWGELFTGLQQGTVDGQENPLAQIYTARFYEVQKHLALTYHTYNPAPLLISDIAWNKLSPEQQQAVQEAANEARDYERQIIAQSDKDLLAKLKEVGMQVTEPQLDAFRQAVQPAWKEMEPTFGKDLIDSIVNVK